MTTLPADALSADSSETRQLRDERPVLFDCLGEQLFGVLHPASGDMGVVIIVGGPQYRAGSHRLFVRLARSLATAGNPVLRFDGRGMGDSSGSLQGFEHMTADVGAAIDALIAQQPQLRSVALWGLCDGASAALLYLHDRPDPRVARLCLVNPWIRSEHSLARTRVKHYYWQRLIQASFWTKLLSGGVAFRAIAEFAASLRTARRLPATTEPTTFQQRMASSWRRLEIPVLLVLSGDDYTAHEFMEYAKARQEWRGLTARPNVQVVDVERADHTFSRPGDAQRLQEALIGWLRQAHSNERTA